MDYKNKKYKILVSNKAYGDMSQREFDLCVVVETEYYREKVNKLKENNIPDYKIVAFIYDLWQDNLIADDAKMTIAYNISNDDWEKGLNYYWHNTIEQNPLKD